MIDYQILPQHRLIVVWTRGTTSVRECIEHTDKIQAEPDHSYEFDVISDVTDMLYDYSSQELEEIIEYTLSLPTGTHPIKTAIVAPTNRTYGTSRMFEQLADGVVPIHTAVFRDWESALAWLGKDPSAIMPCLKTT